MHRKNSNCTSLTQDLKEKNDLEGCKSYDHVLTTKYEKMVYGFTWSDAPTP